MMRSWMQRSLKVGTTVLKHIFRVADHVLTCCSSTSRTFGSRRKFFRTTSPHPSPLWVHDVRLARLRLGRHSALLLGWV